MKRINKFYLLMSFLVLILGLVMIYSVRVVINSFMVASKIERGERLVTVDSVQLEEVYEWALDRENISLLVAEGNPANPTSDQVLQEVENDETSEQE